jgi:predicted O-methyltransferase YrrM
MTEKVYVDKYGLECNFRYSNVNKNVVYYHSTKNMINDHLPYWEEYVGNYAGKPIEMLEIGSFQGQSATWWLDNILTHPQSHLTCVDPFFERKRVPDLEIFMDNIKKTGKKNQTTILRGLSGDILPKLINEGKKYDVIYVDGSHEYKEVLEDCINSWFLLKPKGLLILDDYKMNPRYATDKVGPKPAIDDFLKYLEEKQKGKFEILDTDYLSKRSKSILGYQIQIHKK